MKLTERLAHARHAIMRLFPERHVYLRSGGEMRAFRVSSTRQIVVASAVAAVCGWTLMTSGALALSALRGGSVDAREAGRTVARYERQIADREARLQSAVARLDDAGGSAEDLARLVEARHMALASLLGEIADAPGARAALSPTATASALPVEADDRIRLIRVDQDRMLARAESFARTRAERVRLAFRMAGLDASDFASAAGSGGPLVSGDDPRALAAVLDVDEGFARRIQRASLSLSEMRTLDDAAERAPFGAPVDDANRTSGFGGRFDPFTGAGAFHAGIDFGGAHRTPIEATAPGVVAFVGQRSGYGNVVEIDHGRGMKTRYAHLAAFSVQAGQRVALGQRIGAMGSTGRSTGTHLHYEIWVDGRVQNPDRFLRAGDSVRQG